MTTNSQRYTKYTKETIKKGARAGVYNTNLDVMDYNYLIGDFGGSTVTLINIKTGMIHTCNPSDIYMPGGESKNYLDYDQEVMKVGDKVCFRANSSNNLFEITKINPVEKNCNLYSKTGTRLYDIPLSYLRFAYKTDSVKEEESKVIQLNKKVEEKKNMPKTKKDNVIKKAFDEKKEKLIQKVKDDEETMIKEEEPFKCIKITVKRKDQDILVKCKDSMYSGTAIVQGYFDTSKTEEEKKEAIRQSINNALTVFFDEDKRRRVNVFLPNEGNGYCRFNTISDTFKEEDLCWRTFDSTSVDCLKDLESGNVYRDAHEARSDFYRIKNDLLQKKKQIIEKLNKVDIDEEE